MQVGAGRSCASPSPLVSFPLGEAWPAENTHEQPERGAKTEIPAAPTLPPHPSRRQLIRHGVVLAL